MHDTDRVVRQPVLSSVSDTGKRARKASSLPDWLDRTPTTAPSWAPPPTTRLARGTSLPPIARPGLEPADSILLTERVERVDFTDLVAPLPPPSVEVPTLPPLAAAVRPPPRTQAGRTRRAVPTAELAAIGLPIRVVHPPRRWGSVVMCDLDGVPFSRAFRPRPAPAPAPVLAEGTGQLRIDLDPSARAPSLIPVIAVVSALALTAAVLLGLLLRPVHAPAAPTATAPAATLPVAAPAVIAPSVVPLRDPAAPVVVPLREEAPAPAPLGFKR